MKQKHFRQNLITTIIITTLFTVVFLVAVISPFLFSDWMSVPFIGGFVDPTLHFKKFHKVISSTTWSANDLQWGKNVELFTLGSQMVGSWQEMKNILSEYQPGDMITATVIVDETKLIRAQLELISLSSLDRLVLFYLPYIAGWVCLISGLWILADRRWQKLSLAYAILSGSVGLMFFSWFDYYTTQYIVPLLYIGTAMAAGALTQIAVLLPRTKRIFKEADNISYFTYPIALLIVGLGVFQLNQPDLNIFPISPLIILGVLIFICAFELIVSLFVLLSETLSPHFERQAKTILGALLLSLMPYTIHLLVSLINNTEPLFNPLMMLPFCIFPITLAIIQKPNILPQENNTAFTILVYLSLTLLFGVFYSLVLFIVNAFLDVHISIENPFVLGSLLFFTVLIFYPIRLQIEKLLFSPTNLIIGKKYELALEYSETLSAADSLAKAIQILYDAILEIIGPTQLLFFLYDPKLPGFSTINPYPFTDTQHLTFPYNANLPETLRRYKSSVYFQKMSAEGAEVTSDSEILDQLNVELHIPILGTEDLLGWLSLGKRQDNSQYGIQEVNLLESLTTQFALIYERALSTDELNRRLQEMEILNNIAISINRTNDIDTLLIKIAEQLKKIIQFETISLVMSTEETEHFQRQFVYKNDEIIISSQNPINIDEVFPEQEAILNNQIDLQEDNGAFSLVLPLEITNRAIGALCLQSNDKEINLDQINLNLLSSIGNLITGVIIKTRLLQSSQAQTQYLSFLNQVGRQLSSTLVLDQLLETILENAVDLLNGLAGALILRQENSDDLIIEVVAGELDPEIKGKQVFIVEKLAKEAFGSKKPIIINHYDKEAFSPLLISQITDFDVRNLIVTPLLVKNKTIGLLEIFNRNNNLVFNETDQKVLEGFATQAAIAINNARLYTNTDRALEKRIDELSLMQNIDRDLHSSSSLDSALQTTLQAAVSQTQALCGTIALVDTYNFLIEDIWQTVPGQDNFVSLEDLNLRDFIWFSEEMTDSYQIVDSSVSELNEILNLPIPCETHFLIHLELEENEFVLLILHLESAYKLIESDIGFLVRLIDHAGIALRNALLYGDLQAAVQSKNEFIGFISHELKNPLTAIKGHADILAKGMAGEINAEQEDFLKTISHNVRRMNTFITDLSDQSQIESKSLRIVFSATAVNEVLYEVLQSFEQQFHEKSINISYTANPEIPDVWCDRMRLIQVLSNLISNAVKYTPERGNVEIAAEYAFNNWDQEGAAEVVHFWVKDDGYGISASDQEHIFTKFFRGTSENTLKVSGTGLGLRISKTLVEMMGGTIWFESEVGKGSTFHFTIPI